MANSVLLSPNLEFGERRPTFPSRFHNCKHRRFIDVLQPSLHSLGPRRRSSYTTRPIHIEDALPYDNTPLPHETTGAFSPASNIQMQTFTSPLKRWTLEFKCRTFIPADSRCCSTWTMAVSKFTCFQRSHPAALLLATLQQTPRNLIISFNIREQLSLVLTQTLQQPTPSSNFMEKGILVAHLMSAKVRCLPRSPYHGSAPSAIKVVHANSRCES